MCENILDDDAKSSHFLSCLKGAVCFKIAWLVLFAFFQTQPPIQTGELNLASGRYRSRFGNALIIKRLTRRKKPLVVRLRTGDPQRKNEMKPADVR